MCAIEYLHNAAAILIMAIVLLPLILWQILAVYCSLPNSIGTAVHNIVLQQFFLCTVYI